MSHAGRLASFLVWCLIVTIGASEDLPCAARDVGIEGRSVVCVCNATYCDTITREIPAPGTYVIYTSTDSGKRFEKSYGEIQIDDVDDNEDDEIEDVDIEEDSNEDDFEATYWNTASVRVYVNRRFQFIEGFGGSVTDAASINWRKLSEDAQVKFMDTYFGPEGLEYNMIRVPIAGADFSTHPYTYNEYPRHDPALSNYSLTAEDLFYKLPMIKRAQRTAREEIKITASAWTPPVWMKTNDRITGFGQLLPEYYQAYADYHLRFIEEYAKAEVDIWAITTTNEPVNGIVPLARFNSLGMLPSHIARFVYNNLGPTIRNSPFNSTLILAIDDQRYMLPVYVYGMERAEPRAFDYIDGFALHYYGNFVPASLISSVHEKYPNKIILSTEACEGAMPWNSARVNIGSWWRAKKYVQAILEDLNNYVVGWIDWNLCLDPTGGPNWANNLVDSPILVYGDEDEFIKQPMFYAMGHFSKFIPRGSRRIRVARRSYRRIENLAVITPEGNIVMVLQNGIDNPRRVRIRLDRRRFVNIDMEPQSLKTVEFSL